MLSLSQTTGYAILALACLEDCDGRLVQAKDIAGCTGIPLPYLSKILYALGKVGLVVTKRGYRGGFALARSARQINLLEVAEAVEGGTWLPKCLLGFEGCADDRACPTHRFWKTQREKIQTELRRVTIHDVAQFEHAAGRGLRAGCCRGNRQDLTESRSRTRKTGRNKGSAFKKAGNP
jgi:Rrf2 family protein